MPEVLPGLELGVLAGGAGSRAGGQDKAWLQRQGRAQLPWLLDALGLPRQRTLIASSRSTQRYRDAGLRQVDDALGGFQGPMAGLVALLQACSLDYLLTVPVDLAFWPDALAGKLLEASRASEGACYLVDDDGRQPLVAVYPVQLATQAADAFQAGERSVRAWQDVLGATPVALPGHCIGNLNSLADFDR